MNDNASVLHYIKYVTLVVYSGAVIRTRHEEAVVYASKGPKVD